MKWDLFLFVQYFSVILWVKRLIFRNSICHIKHSQSTITIHNCRVRGEIKKRPLPLILTPTSSASPTIKIVVQYGSKEPVELFIEDSKLREQFIGALIDQRKRLHLSLGMEPKIPENELEVSSAFCWLCYIAVFFRTCEFYTYISFSYWGCTNILWTLCFLLFNSGIFLYGVILFITLLRNSMLTFCD